MPSLPGLKRGKWAVLRARRWWRDASGPLRFRLISLALLLLILTVSAFLPSPQTLTSLKARSELAQFAVRPIDTIQLPQVRVISAVGAKDGRDLSGLCLSGLRLRVTGGMLTLARPSNGDGAIILSNDGVGQAVIEADGIADLPDEAFEPLISNEPVFFAMDPTGEPETGCAGSSAGSISVSGPVQIGDEAEAGDGKLLEGGLRVYGRVRAGLLAILAGQAGDYGETIIYEASTLELPAGSRVGSLLGADREVAIWHGVIAADPNEDAKGFSVQLQTVAKDVYVWNGAADGSRPDKISIGWIARLAADPYLQWLFAAVLILLTFVGIAAQRIPTGK